MAGVVFLLFFFSLHQAASREVWGYQNNGRDGIIDVDDEGYVYYAGKYCILLD